MKTSGQLHCRWPINVGKQSKRKLSHTFKGNGRTIYATTESKGALDRVSRAQEALSGAKLAAAAERAEKSRMKNALDKKRHLMNSGVVKATDPIQTAKDGSLYIQPRVKGKFGQRIVVG